VSALLEAGLLVSEPVARTAEIDVSALLARLEAQAEEIGRLRALLAASG
jgi:hypothetical protein